ncbi:hypothetical protein FRC14_000052 [Serendipita sp. 396]|nr:hypothetical protein FRC14_000052 [Serendipita sp. 396]KAG8789868.1 hypothetical protein FRC15_000060 [Serendipita sp. 397]KAG8860376.1 hypothetical protein FRB91_003789 [Serendipita sp. 411]KAG8879461.1 hypothetical protein FRC20_000033 [Serendipita sp. 405]
MHITQLPVELILDILQSFVFTDDQFATSVEWSWQSKEWRNWWDPTSKDARNPGSATILAFSRTNRYFRGISIPLVYSRLSVTTVGEFQIAMDHRHHVQLLRCRFTSRWANKKNPELVNDGQILTLLAACTNLNTFVVLYDYNLHIPRDRPSDETIVPVSRKAISLLKSGQLKTLAVAIHVGYYGNPDQTAGPTTLLTEILGKDLSLGNQQTIHMALHFSAMPKLSLDQELTFRSGRNALTETIHPFSPSPNLVSLHLRNCRDVCAQYLPDLILCLPKLQYLYVSSVGGSRLERQTPGRSLGWSEHRDAVWRKREPLKGFHVEDATEWQIWLMGTIPACVVTITGIRREAFNKPFLRDSEIFPCMRVLRCEPTYDIPIRYWDYPWTLKEVIDQRQVVLKADATRNTSGVPFQAKMSD